jgi:hypothetical protein
VLYETRGAGQHLPVGIGRPSLVRFFLGNGQRLLVVDGFTRGSPFGRKLQHCRALTGPELGYQDGLAIGKFQGVVMTLRVIEINLSKASDLSPQFPEPEPRKKLGEGMTIFRLLFEGDLGASSQANGDVWLSNCGETAGDRACERRRD